MALHAQEYAEIDQDEGTSELQIDIDFSELPKLVRDENDMDHKGAFWHGDASLKSTREQIAKSFDYDLAYEIDLSFGIISRRIDGGDIDFRPASHPKGRVFDPARSKIGGGLTRNF